MQDPASLVVMETQLEGQRIQKEREGTGTNRSPPLVEHRYLDYLPTSLFGFVSARWSLINHSSQVASESTFPCAPAVNPAGVVPVEALAATGPPVVGAALQLVGATMLLGSVNAVGVVAGLLAPVA
jgi:hypothetical protein